MQLVDVWSLENQMAILVVSKKLNKRNLGRRNPQKKRLQLFAFITSLMIESRWPFPTVRMKMRTSGEAPSNPPNVLT